MRVFLTGASGEIGQPLVAILHRLGHDLVILSRRPAPPTALGTWVQGDLRDAESLARALSPAPDAVIHMAAITHTRRGRDYDATNVEGTAALIAACEAAAVPHFIHLSTRAIGAPGGAYAASKARAEELVRGGSLPWTILRPAEVYGSGGEDPILNLARSLQRQSFVPILGDGRYQLSPVHAEDVVAAVAATLNAPTSRGQTYLLAGPESLSYLELIERLERILNLPRRRRIRVPLWIARSLIRAMSTFGIGGYVPDQIPRLLLAKETDSTAARRDLGFNPRGLEAGLAALSAVSPRA